MIELFTLGKHYKRIHPKAKFPIRIGLRADDSQVSRSPLHQIKEVIYDMKACL